MRKILVILLISILCVSGYAAVANNVNKIPDIRSNTFFDDLDQYQTEMTENTVVIVGQVPIPENPFNIQVAQSFIPTKNVLTRVELYIGKNTTTTYPYNVAIRHDLTESDLTMISVNPDLIPNQELGWVEFDFEDIPVNTGETYYIVSYTENTTENYYGMGANNISESYPDGCAWFSFDDGFTWTNESIDSSPTSIETSNYHSGIPTIDRVVTWDTCFKTYGQLNLPPGITEIIGPATGKPNTELDFELTATDPDGDNIKYHIDWGDGNTEWTSLFASGTPAAVSHSWTNKGDFAINVYAQDQFGSDGSISTFEITIPKNKAVSNPFIKILGNYPQILQILLKILLKDGQ